MMLPKQLMKKVRFPVLFEDFLKNRRRSGHRNIRRRVVFLERREGNRLLHVIPNMEP